MTDLAAHAAAGDVGLTQGHRPFTLVLGGGGARGFAHLGVLRGLEREGLHPRAVVGVSMGAVVGVAYAMREDWYRAVLDMKLADFPGPTGDPDGEPLRLLQWIRSAATTVRVVLSMVRDWGPAAKAKRDGLDELRRLVGHDRLETARIPVAVIATDLLGGGRVVLSKAPADDAVYASGALAGVLPPLELGDWLLADGAYTDLAPVDVAREMEAAAVIAVDAGWLDRAGEIRNGFRAIVRAMEICHRQHAHLRFAEADLTLRPRFRRSIDTLEFSARRECVAAGIRIVRQERQAVRTLLEA